MVTARACQRRSPLYFGRRMPPQQSSSAAESSLADDIRLFGMFFLGGLTFMSVYLA